jgi:hypothetical protein
MPHTAANGGSPNGAQVGKSSGYGNGFDGVGTNPGGGEDPLGGLQQCVGKLAGV